MAVRRHHERRHGERMARDRQEFSAVVRIPESDGSVSRSSNEALTVGRKRERRRLISVPGQLNDRLATIEIPQHDHRPIVRHGETSTIATDDELPNTAMARAKPMANPLSVEIEYRHRALGPSDEEAPCVADEGEVPDGLVTDLERPQRRSLPGLPEADASPPSPALRVTVDTTIPDIVAVVAPPAGLYRAAAPLDVVVTFSQAVAVGGVPTIDLTIGSSVRKATYVSGSGFTSLRFRYVIAKADNDADGIAVAAAIRLPTGASIRSVSSGNASRLIFQQPNTKAVIVKG